MLYPCLLAVNTPTPPPPSTSASVDHGLPSVNKHACRAGEQLSARSYTWSQTDDEVSVELACPAGCRGRELLVEFKPTSISVTHKPSGAQLLHGPLYANVKHNECTWDLDAEEGVLSIVLEKSLKADSIALSGKERWSCVVVGHPQIDINVDGDEPDKPSVQEIMSKHLNK